MSQMIGGQITVNIDGDDVKVPMGTTILEAAKRIGVRIPTLCHHPDLCVAGVCRVCVVEVEGQRALQAACAFPVTGSLKVKTHTRKVRQARRHILDLLLSTHYGECYSCKRNNNCELQSLAKEYGVDFYRFGHVTESQYAEGRVELLRRPRHGQVHPVPALRAHLHRRAGSRRARGRRPQRQDPHLDLPRQAARRRGVHQLRPVHQPLPDRRAARQRHVRRDLARHRRPEEARRHPDRAEPARGHRRVLRPASPARR